MSRRFLITSTDARVGKTTVGCALAFAFKARGQRVGVMKPADVGCVERDGELYSADSDSLALAASCSIPSATICPYRYRSRFAPIVAATFDKSPPPDLSHISRCFREIAMQSDSVLVEGTGGIADPVVWGTDFADLAAMLELEVLVVVGNRAGCLNLAALTLSHLQSKSVQVAGFILCDIDQANLQAEAASLEVGEQSIERLIGPLYLGRMRHREPLAKSIVENLL